MKTNEIEKILGISKQTIMFYEKEGLLKPLRDNNGYRNYSEEDLEILKVIKLLRSMEVGIDDIKLVLNGELSFHECLETKAKYVDEQAEEIKEVQKTVHTLKEKQLPLIPSLNDVDIKENRKSLGYQRGSEKVSLGRRLSRSHLIKQAIRNIFYIFILTGCTCVGYTKMYNKPVTSTVIAVLAIVYTILFAFCFTNNNTSGYVVHPMSEFFIELDETGLTLYHPKNIIEYYKNIYTVLFSGKYKYEYRYLYEDIKTVTITSQRRKGLTALPPYSLSGYTMNFAFDFDDGRHVFMNNPMILDDDAIYFALILKDKCKNIVDKENLLTAMEKGVHIDDFKNERS